MRVVVFEGTKEEFEAIRPLVQEEEVVVEAGVSEVDEEDAGTQQESSSGEDRPPTYEEVVKILRFRGGPSRGQEDILRVLFQADGPVHSSTIRDEHGWSNARFRGIRANFPRRTRGALGRKDVFWVNRNWDSEEGENTYSLPETVRQALIDELGW